MKPRHSFGGFSGVASHPMQYRRSFARARRAGSVLAVALTTVGLGGCFASAPEIKTDQVMDNFKKDTRDRVVVDRNYEVGQRYRVLPG
ncbi:MAG: hypothetical protein IT563_17010, partial [Alphaproteobacteria bacterium]|nr:hypothetical protein [Alphaproteobacteria bacterium]